jgi:hypothetical protein
MYFKNNHKPRKNPREEEGSFLLINDSFSSQTRCEFLEEKIED